MPSNPPWELRLGYELEEMYCIFELSPDDTLYLFSHREGRRIQARGGWMVHKLTEMSIEKSLIDNLKYALKCIPIQESPAANNLTHGLIMSILRVNRRLGYLINSASIKVGRPGRRYFDYGVMLCRLHMLNVKTRRATTIPAHYHEEIQRAGDVLEQFIVHTDEYRPRDPRHASLDRCLDDLAEYLKEWRTSGADPDQNFFNNVESVLHTIGLAQDA